MDLVADRGRRVTVEELNTSKLLAHARKQAHQRNYDDMVIVDCDAHHYENENFDEILPFMENDVLRQLSMSSRTKGGRGAFLPSSVGYQDMGGRVTRYPMRGTEKTEPGRQRDVQLGERWMDAMGVDYSCLFPTGMLNIGMHPQKEVEVELCWAYNRWLTEKVLPETGGRIYSMLCLPLSDPDASLRQVEAFGACKGVTGFMVTTVRNIGVHDNALMKVYRAIEERGLTLAFHSGPNWQEPVFKSCNRFLSVHALGFSFYNILHCTNWVINGMGERFPKLPVIWIEAGLAWIPFLMQRLDHEYMLRPSEAPLLKKKPSEYMRDMYYSTQPMEIQDLDAMKTTFRMMNAETQLLYASDYPHWDFDLPSTIYDLPFLSEKAKHNILGGTAARSVQAAAAKRQAEREPEEVRQSGGLSTVSERARLPFVSNCSLGLGHSLIGVPCRESLPFYRASLLSGLERSFRFAARQSAKQQVRSADRGRSVSSLLRRVAGCRRTRSGHHAQRASPDRHLHVVNGGGGTFGAGAHHQERAPSGAWLSDRPPAGSAARRRGTRHHRCHLAWPARYGLHQGGALRIPSLQPEPRGGHGALLGSA